LSSVRDEIYKEHTNMELHPSCTKSFNSSYTMNMRQRPATYWIQVICPEAKNSRIPPVTLVHFSLSNVDQISNHHTSAIISEG
jgi:hypothetical protein